MSALILQYTTRYSVLTLKEALTPIEGTEVPLDDTCLQVLLESLNLTPISTTEKVPTLNAINLPELNHSIIIEQDTEISQVGQGGTGGIIWESSKALTQFLAHHYQTNNVNESSPSLPQLVIEIGSGTGMLGIAIAHLFHDINPNIILTDQRNVVPLIHRNVQRNSNNNQNYNIDDINIFPMDWNLEQDRIFLINQIHMTLKHLQVSNMVQQKQNIEILILCSDLVFGNNFENLLLVLQQILCSVSSDSPSSTLSSSLSSSESPQVENFNKLIPKTNCRILFCFEERDDRFPSPGFQNCLHSTFNVNRPRSIPHDFIDRFPRIELNWLSMLST